MPIPDNLPPYRRDPETSSIRSSAPSYVSAVPSYHSSTLPRYSSGLTSGSSRPRLAPGLRSRTASMGSGLDAYNISSWTPIHGSHQTRAYHSVASRRATVAAGATLHSAMSSPGGPPSMCHRKGGDLLTARHLEEQNRNEEDAARNGDDVLRQEDKAWDFMLAQMADWEGREKSWKKFRESLKRGNVLSRRIGGSFG